MVEPRFIIRDAQNRVVVDELTSVGRVLGYVDVRYDTNPTGSFSDPRLAEGVPWAFVQGSPYTAPTVSGSGWSPGPHTSLDPTFAHRIFYGTF